MGAGSLEGMPRQAVEHLLHTARRHLDMEAAFLAELTDSDQIYQATSGADSFTIHEGGSLPRVGSYCQYVLESGEPWVVRDTEDDERARRLAITSAGGFGAYIGVPVHLPDGRPFGTLCCLSHMAKPDLGDREVAVLEALADTLAFHVAQLEDHAGRIAELEAHTEELTRAVRQSELRLGLFAEVIDASETPTLVIDPATLTIDFANAAAASLMGVAPHEAVDVPLWDLHPAWTEEEVRELLGPLTDGTAETVRSEQDPREGWPPLEVIAQVVTTASGDTMILWSALDITEHREVERRLERTAEREHAAAEQLRQLEQLRYGLLSAVSHELRTPLTAILGTVATLRERSVPAVVSDKLMERLAVNADRLNRLLTDLLDLNEFMHRTGRVQRERVRLDELVRGALDQLELDGPDPVLDLEPVEAEVAPSRFERVVLCLVTNAAIHSEEPEPVEIRLTRSDGGALLVVSDKGSGVAPEDREAVFRPFWQGETAPAHSPGVGIGLSVVAAFSELHGGRTWVEDATDGGAAFHVWFPLGTTD